MGYRTRVERYFLVHDNRTRSRINDHQGAPQRWFDVQIFKAPKKGNAGIDVIRSSHRYASTINSAGSPRRHRFIDRLDHILRRSKVGARQLVINESALTYRRRNITFDRGTSRDSTCRKVVNRNFGASG